MTAIPCSPTKVTTTTAVIFNKHMFIKSILVLNETIKSLKKSELRAF